MKGVRGVAISEKDILFIHKGKSSYILLREKKYFHLVRADAALDERKYVKLLELYPCDNSRLEKLGLHFSAFKCEKLRGVTVNGCGRGDVLALWIGADVREYVLERDTDFEEIEAFFSGYTLVDSRPAKWNGLDPSLVRNTAWALNIGSALCAFYFYFVGLPYKLFAIICALIFAAGIILVSLFPESFTLEDVKDSYSGARSKSHEPKEANLLLAVSISGAALMLKSFTAFTFAENGMWKLMLLSGLVVLGLLGVGYAYCRYVRFCKPCQVYIIIILALLGSGIGLQLNYALDAAPTETVSARVIEKDLERHTKFTSYDCTIELSDGNIIVLDVSGKDYRKIEEGETLLVDIHEGAFNVPFYRIGG